MGYTNGISTHRVRTVRNAEIYERLLLGESQASLAREFKVTAPRIHVITQNEEQRRRLAGEPWGHRLLLGWARAAYLEGLEPDE
jgi:hypothetical protein